MTELPPVPFRAWNLPLQVGYDVLGDLARWGVELDEGGVPNLAAARLAWERFGDRIMLDRHPRLRQPWARLQFGWIAPEDRE